MLVDTFSGSAFGSGCNPIDQIDGQLSRYRGIGYMLCHVNGLSGFHQLQNDSNAAVVQVWLPAEQVQVYRV